MSPYGIAKLSTSSRLLAWRFNTLQVYDLLDTSNVISMPLFPFISV